MSALSYGGYSTDFEYAYKKYMPGSSPYIYESSKLTGKDDIMLKSCITRTGKVAFFYTPQNNRNLKEFYKNIILESVPQQHPFHLISHANMNKTNVIIKFINLGLPKVPVINPPKELEMLHDNWAWCKKGFGVDEGGLISNAYGITMEGTCVQLLDFTVALRIIDKFLEFYNSISCVQCGDRVCNTLFDLDMHIKKFKDFFSLSANNERLII